MQSVSPSALASPPAYSSPTTRRDTRSSAHFTSIAPDSTRCATHTNSRPLHTRQCLPTFRSLPPSPPPVRPTRIMALVSGLFSFFGTSRAMYSSFADHHPITILTIPAPSSPYSPSSPSSPSAHHPHHPHYCTHICITTKLPH